MVRKETQFGPPAGQVKVTVQMMGLKFGQPYSLGVSVNSGAEANASPNGRARGGISPEGKTNCRSTVASEPDSGAGVLVSPGCPTTVAVSSINVAVGVLVSPGWERLAIGSVSGAACVAPRNPEGAWMMINMRKAASNRVRSMTLFMSYSSFVTNSGMGTEMSPDDWLTGRVNEIEQTRVADKPRSLVPSMPDLRRIEDPRSGCIDA
jgi:hypothetical protein